MTVVKTFHEKNGKKKKLKEQYTIDGSSKKKNGKYKRWWSNGHPSEESTYKNDQLCGGKCTLWYDNGNPMKHSVYNAEGEQHGPCTLWYLDGGVSMQGTYEHGEWHGVWTFFPRLFPSSPPSCKEERTYQNDELHGSCKEWDESGTLVSHCIYENGEEVEQIV